MENIEIKSDENKLNVTKPFLVKVISIWGFIATGFIVLGYIGMIISSPNNIILGGYMDLVINMLFTLIIFVSAIGLWKMKKWGIYLLTIEFIFGLANSFYLNTITGSGFDDMIHLRIILKVVILIYLWSIHKKFN